MALSMEEQRILAQIEEHLAGADPGLAARLSSFGRAGDRRPLRLPQRRLAGPAAALLAVAIVSLVVYALIPFRALPGRGVPGSHPSASHPSGQVTQAVMTERRTPGPASPRAASPTAGPQHTAGR